MSTSTPGRLSRKELLARVESGDIDTVILAITDMQGRLQGKRIDASFFVDGLIDGVVEGCSYVLASDVDMNTVEGFALTSWERGYGDLAFAPDFSTVRHIPWHEKTAIVFADVQTTDGDPVKVSPRQVLQHQVDRLAERGWSGLTGTELEFIVFSDTYEDAWNAGYRELTPANQYNVDYSLLGTSRIEPLLGRVRRSMRDAGMVVESLKGECNFGQHEIAFKYAPLVDKCDEHSLFKLGTKEIASQEGCSITFMAKYNVREGNSCHIHLSLRDENDAPVFAGENAHGFSDVFEHFLAGQVAYARELSLFLAPNINSYKRFVEGSFAPTAMLWGIDNRTCAFRVVGHGSSIRVECRIPGGDVNPYLAVAALVAAGLRGVEESLPLAPAFGGNAYVADAPRVPTTLHEATDLFATSAVARHAFGDEVVDHYTHAARIEVAAFDAAVTDWERYRGFERL
ncbi:MAG TPA: glutamine synthetase family protein [Acidimicrobiales bacterium]|nr:glutamine synthetase family protein [Acidimicrobiales bacterium]